MKARVGLTGGSKMFPAAVQKRQVEAAGIDRLYELSAGETVKNVVGGIREGETLVIPGLYAFRLKRKELVPTLAELAAKKIIIERARDRLRLPIAAVEWAVEDLSAMAGEARLKSRENASKQGKKGGRPPNDKPMTDASFMRIWRKRLPSDERAKLAGISERSAFRWAERIKRDRQNAAA